MNPSAHPKCPLCGGDTSPVYRMGEYSVCKCGACGTGQASPMPCRAELQAFYKGFRFAMNSANLPTILSSAPRLYAQLGLTPGSGLHMLDVGGGGGFYAKAFEEAGYGASTYIDLDSEACEFARREVDLERVLNHDVTCLDGSTERYDFIMCRHLVEHLVDPADFILKLSGLLAGGGVLLLVCPNGDSLEYFAYPQSNLKQRIDKIATASGLSKASVVFKLLSGAMLHGIDPPRHLWAISRQGMRQFLADHRIDAAVTTHSLTDPLYSPYHRSRTLLQKASAVIGNSLVSKLTGGTHLAVVITNSSKSESRHAA